MIYDLMPVWLRRLLGLDRAVLPTERWTWRHVCRYGGDPGKLADDVARAMRPGGRWHRPASLIFRRSSRD